MLNNPEICFVIPVFNEEECVEQVLNAWINTLYFLRIDYHVIIINDGSTDNTTNILDDMAKTMPHLTIYHRENSGHGKSILFGYQKALELMPTWIFQVDSDNQFHPGDFHLFWDQRENSHFTLGIRSNRQDPISRLLISSILRLMLRLSFFVKIKDANIPYRLIKANLLATLLPKIPDNTFAPNVWLSLLAKKSCAHYKEIWVQHLPRLTGNPSLPSFRLIKACLASAIQLIKLRFKSLLNPHTFPQFSDQTQSSDCSRQHVHIKS